MDAIARMTSKGQLTVPKEVRDALGLATGDAVLFRVEGERALVTRIPRLAEIAGSVPVAADLPAMTWHEVRAAAHRAVGLEFERERFEPT